MISRHHVAPRQRGIDVAASSVLRNAIGIDGAVLVEPVEFREVHEHACDGEVADPRSRVAVVDRYLRLLLPSMATTKSGHPLLRSRGRAGIGPLPLALSDAG